MSQETSFIDPFVAGFRQSAPYIHAHRGRTFVVYLGGEAVADPGFAHLLGDIALLAGLGVRLVLVAGARPQIEARCRTAGVEPRYVDGLRVTDVRSLECVKAAAGVIRVEIESILSAGLPGSPLAGANLRVTSGNFVTAQPIGVVGGVDFQHTGRVRRVDAQAIRGQLDTGAVVLLSLRGYSPSGEVFNLRAEEVAAQTSIALGAHKLIALVDAAGLHDADGRLRRQLLTSQAEKLIAASPPADPAVATAARALSEAARGGVARCHLIDRRVDGALLRELFTRDGIGTLIASDPFDVTRQARIDDIGGILALIEPLEQGGVLVRRSREQLETEIDRFQVIERDGMVIACAALYPFADARTAELACLAVHPSYRGSDRGEQLLRHVESIADAFASEIFVLTTQSAHWFIEHGFREVGVDHLPIARKAMYNWQRNSKVLVKPLAPNTIA